MAIVDVLKVQGDYKIQTQPQGNIILDTTGGVIGANSGTVTITGNLQVNGDMVQISKFTNVSQNNLDISDNTIVLNSGETNSYVTALTAGIIIDRGNGAQLSSAATILYNDAVDNTGVTWKANDPGGRGGYRGQFEFKSATQFSAIKVNGIRSDPSSAPTVNGKPRLNIFGEDNPTMVLSVSGTVDYADNCTDGDDIPNVTKVNDLITAAANTPSNIRQLVQLNSKVLLTDDGTNAPTVKINLGGPNVQFVFNESGELLMNGYNSAMTLIDSSISAVATTSTTQPLSLSAYGTAGIELRNYLQLADQSYSNAFWTGQRTGLNPGETIVYSSATTAVSGGGTNLFFVNNNNKTDTQGNIIPEELVSRRRALVYAIVF
jgi:hypothetical protein